MYKLSKTLLKNCGKNTYFNCNGTKEHTFNKLSEVISYIENFSGDQLIKFMGTSHKRKIVNVIVNEEYRYNFIIEYMEV